MLTLNSVPSGSGLRSINDIDGSPPVFVVRGTNALIDSSSIFLIEAAMFASLFLLKPSSKRRILDQGCEEPSSKAKENAALISLKR